MYAFKVPEQKKIDVILATDAKNEADDQYAITYALLSEKLKVHGIIASHFGKKRSETSMEESFQECCKVASLLHYDLSKIHRGNVEPLGDRQTLEVSEGARFLIETAHQTQGTLYVGVMGPLTDVAAALLADETIADKLCVVWTGTLLHYKDGDVCREANAKNDPKALNVLMEKCSKFIVIPFEAYNRHLVSIAELQLKVRPCGEIGKYLFEELVDLNQDLSRTFTAGDSWCLGDHPVVGILLNPRCGTMVDAARYTLDTQRAIHMGEGSFKLVADINVRYILEDFFAKIALYAASESQRQV